MPPSTSSTSTNSPSNNLDADRNQTQERPGPSTFNNENIRAKEECVDDQSTASRTDACESNVWAQIFDENGVEMLEECETGEDEPMDGSTTSASQSHGASVSEWTQHDDSHGFTYNENRAESRGAIMGPSFGGPLFPHAEPASSAAMMDSWQHHYSDHEMSSSMMDSTNMIPNSMHVTGNHISTSSTRQQFILPGMDILQQQQNPDVFGTGSMWSGFHRPMAQDSLQPSQILTMERQKDGIPFPLSKPLLRDDGVLLVGTSLPSNTGGGPSNRIFVTNYKTFQASQPPPFLQTQAKVCDLQWITSSTAIAAIGPDIHILQVGSTQGDRRCRLLDALECVHSDTIREIAVKHPNMMSSPASSLIASGGFDETIVVTDLRQATSSIDGRNITTSMVTKFDGCDVVSSLRWIPNEVSQLSWTTDGGDFQVADLRIRTAQLQVPLYSILPLAQTSGLFCHEYLSNHKVALGFGTGHIGFIDIRMPRNTCCYETLSTRMEAIGEITTHNGVFGFFGINGFSTAHINSAMNRFDNWTLSHTYPGVKNKTSGAFSIESGNVLAVSDNYGVVSIYNSNIPISLPPLPMMRGDI